MNNQITTIEFTLSGIKLVTGYVFNDKVYVLEALEGNNIPVDDNGFMKKKETEESLKLLLSTATKALKTPLGNFVILLPPDEFQTEESSASTFTVSETISQKDYANAINMLNKRVKIDNLSIIYDDPIGFGNDATGQTGEFPLGKRSENLDVRADAHMISKVTYEYYVQILKDLGILPYLTIVAPFGSSEFLTSSKAPVSFFTLELEKEHTYLSFTSNRRLKMAKQVSFSLSQLYSMAGKELGLSEGRMKELGETFGLRDDAGFPYLTDEKKSLKEISKSLKDALSVLLPLKQELDQWDSSHLIPLIFLGQGAYLDGLDFYFTSLFGRQVLSFSSKVLGARNKSMINCLGGIKLTDQSYMPPLRENQRKEMSDLSRSSFSRD